MIKRHILAVTAALFLLSSQMLFAQDYQALFEALPSVKKVEKIDGGQAFPNKYLLWFEQPISHKDPSKGTFLQRVFVGCTDRDSSSVFVAEGYGAAYAARPTYKDELAVLFNLNNVVVEHRYFLESRPDAGWEYLTAENAANDYHRVITELKTVFPKKWIGTGISKGGQNSAIFRAFFPDDVDITVPYVGPFCRSREDGRHEPFIADFCGSLSDRKAVREFQTEFLKRREALTPMLEALVKEKKYEYRIPLNEVYDMMALEFSFAFWQWGTPVENIPSSNASDKEIFDFMVEVSGPDYWEKESNSTPFFVMAAHELGYYGYDVKPFKKLLTIKSAKGYLERIFVPEDARNLRFDKTLSKKMKKFLKTTDARMLFIYGEFDPWSSVRVFEPTGENIHIYIDPAGSHRARIRTFPAATQDEIKGIIASWLYE